MGSAPVLELFPAVDNSQPTTVWSLRFSGAKRGRFGALSSTGEVKLYDLASHSMDAKARSTDSNFLAGSPWQSSHYIAHSHTLQHTYDGTSHTHDESRRAIAFDWMSSAVNGNQSVLVLRSSRDVSVLRAPQPLLATVTPRDDLCITTGDMVVYEASRTTRSSTDHGDHLPEKSAKANNLTSSSITDKHRPSTERMSPNVPKSSNARGLSLAAQRTERWIKGNAGVQPSPKLDGPNMVGDVLTSLNIHRRRCQEGYRFDCQRNREIVEGDSSLVKLWAIIGRLEGLAAGGKMDTEYMGLSYIGVHGIWHGHSGRSTNRYPAGRASVTSDRFEAAVRDLVVSHNLPRLEDIPPTTSYRRILSLEICGWCFSRDGIEAKCTDLLEKRQYYRAIAITFFQGHPDLSLNMLRNLTRRKIISDTGLGALLAAESLNEEQRNMCIWMEEDADEPYLRVILRYLARRNWQDVVDTPSLNLSDRLSVALRYLADAELAVLIDRTTESCIRKGDLSGVLLTGLTSSSMDLFQTYLNASNDLQTTVLATSFTNPLYVNDVRFTVWKETYLWHMQAWRAFIERTKFTVEHSRRAVKRNGDRLIKPAGRQITLRCAHCNSSLAHPQDENKHRAQVSFSSTTKASQGQVANPARNIAQAAGTVCPRCARHLPRCSICMLWLGAPDSSKGKLGNRALVSDIVADREQGSAKRETELLSHFVTFCASCGHASHAQHAKHWFSKHGMCPVPDCQCLCGIRA